MALFLLLLEIDIQFQNDELEIFSYLIPSSYHLVHLYYARAILGCVLTML